MGAGRPWGRGDGGSSPQALEKGAYGSRGVFSLRERVTVRGACFLRVRVGGIVLLDAIKGCVTAQSLSCAIQRSVEYIRTSAMLEGG